VAESVVGVDQEQGTLYVNGTYDGPLEKHLYSVPLAVAKAEEGSNRLVQVIYIRPP